MAESPSIAGHGSGRYLGTEYTLTFINNSYNSWNFCCYQKDPAILGTGALAVAWFLAANVHPTTSIRFEWQISYGLSWSQSGAVTPGCIYYAAQDWPVSQSQNTVSLTKLGGSYTFEDPRAEEPASADIIVQDGTIVSQDEIGIGLAMRITAAWGGAAGLSTIYAQPAQPNVTTKFSVTPEYYVIFADGIEPGEILDVAKTNQRASATGSVEVPYPPGVFSNVVTLDQQNNWHVATTAAINKRYLEAVKHDPDVTWAEVAGKTGRAAASFLRGRPGARGD